MSGRNSRRAFVARPSGAETWIRKPDPMATSEGKGDRLYGAADHRCHTGAARAHQNNRLPTRRHGCRHAARSARPRIPGRAGVRHDLPFTMVELTWIEKRVERWIRFGSTVEGHRSPPPAGRLRARQHLRFCPLGVERLRHHRLTHRHLACVAPGEAFSTLPFVRPGGDILLRITGWPKVERALQAIDAMEAAGIDPMDASPDHWQHIHNRLTAGEEPRRYTPARHPRGFSGRGGSMTPAATLLAMVLGVSAASLALTHVSTVIWNASASVPVGLYAMVRRANSGSIWSW